MPFQAQGRGYKGAKNTYILWSHSPLLPTLGRKEGESVAMWLGGQSFFLLPHRIWDLRESLLL